MLELTPLVAHSGRDERVPDARKKGTPWMRILAVVGLVVVGGLMVRTKVQDAPHPSLVSRNEHLVRNVDSKLEVTNDFGQCGPTAVTKGPAHVYVPGRIIGCDGPFTGGLFSASAQSLCDKASGWRICTGASDAKAQGLTTALCAATTDKKFYATQQRGTGHHLCNNQGSNDVFGCSKGLGLHTALSGGCSPLGATGSNLFAHYNANPKQWSCAACNRNGLDELLKVSHKLNGAKAYDGGVMCCKSAQTCPSGQYFSSGKCNACPAGYFCANNQKTICPAGKYQSKPGQATCTPAACGKFVPGPGATQEETCRAGTYSAAGAQRCTPVAKGEFSAAGACVPGKCPDGEYQDCEGQSKCNPAPCGHFVLGTGKPTYAPCPPGTYQPKTGQKTCLKTPAGSYSGRGYCKPRLCAPGSYQVAGEKGSCKPASCGHYVSSGGSQGQVACGKGLYQPEVGQPSCIAIPAGYISVNSGCGIQCCPKGTYRDANFQCVKAPCGSFVSTTCSSAPAKCPPGEYTSTNGQSGCVKAPAGSIPNPNQCGTQKCKVGEYQDATGQTTCKPAQCGEIAPMTGMSLPQKCGAGTFQSKTRQTTCDACPAGSANGKTGQCVCPKCKPGTFQPSMGKKSCTDSPCGSFVSSTGATKADPCPPGQYQNQVKQIGCIKAPAGKYAVGGKCQPSTCPPGTFTGTAGLTKCTDAPCGSMVATAGQTGPTMCPAGKYQPLIAQTSCLPAPSGSFTSGQGKCKEELCKPGSYQPGTGQTGCKPADCGHYVAITGSANQNPCGAGRYQPGTGKTSCLPADLGHFVTGNTACKQDRCPAGTYTDCKGQAACTTATCGHFVRGTGKQAPQPCPAGTFQDTPGQAECKPNPAGSFSKQGFCHAQLCDPGQFQNAAGQAACKLASCGNFVDGEGRQTETKCPSGTYQPKTGQVGCLRTTHGMAPNPGTCQKGTVNGIFYSGPSRMSWANAKAWCASNGDRLAIVRSGKENGEVVNVCKDAGKVCWIGGSDLATEGKWLWVDGTPLAGSYKNWSPNEPNGGRGENCLMTWSRGTGWNDGGCAGALEFVCERRHQVPVVTVPGLIIHYNFLGNKPTTDRVGGVILGVHGGAKVANALQFRGAGQYAMTTTNLQFPGGALKDKTMTAWVKLLKTNHLGHAAGAFISLDQTYDNAGKLISHVNFDAIVFGEYPAGKTYIQPGSEFGKRWAKGAQLTGPQQTQAGVVQMISLVTDQKNKKMLLYINDKKVMDYTPSVGVPNYGGQARLLSAWRHYGHGVLDADIYDLKVFNRVLSGAEIGKLYQQKY